MYTWKSSEDRARYKIVFFYQSKIYKYYQDGKTLPGAGADTDNKLLVMALRMKLNMWRGND